LSIGKGVALFLMLTATGCDRRASAPTPTPASRGCPSCAAAIPTNGRCEHCDVGYVAGVPIKSKLLYETMDAHGHQLMHEALTCAVCRRLASEGGFCDTCHIGWYHGDAYFSRLTYEIARAKLIDISKLECQTCRDNAASAGWCADCRRGMIGPFAITDRADFEAGRRDFDRMVKAVALSERCDYCAMAAVTDTACFKCKITYKDGDAIESPKN